MATTIMKSVHIYFPLIVASLVARTLATRAYYMDMLSDCGRTVNVDDDGTKIHGRSLTAPSNPPLLCIIYLRSGYTRNDGSNKLQVEINYLNIKDCNIRLDLYNGRRSVGETMKALSCQRKTAKVIYSTGNEVTVKLTLPDILYQTEYGFTLTIKPWKDGSVLTSDENNEKLSIGAIIGIVIGCLIIIAVLILLCWFCCSGRISGIGNTFNNKSKRESPGLIIKPQNNEKFKPPALVLNDPNVWNTNVGSGYDNQYQPRYFQKGIPRNEIGMTGPDRNMPPYNERQFDYDRHQGEGRGYGNVNAPNNQRKNRWPEKPKDFDPNENNEEIKTSSPRQPKKETLIDDVFDSDSNTQLSVSDDATLQKRPIGRQGSVSPNSKRKSKPVPEEEEDVKKSPQLERYKSMDLQSQPDTDTITSQVHVNAGVRASVEDDIGDSPVGRPRKNKESRSPKSKRKDGKQPDSMAMPPEAFEPIFTEPITGINYPTNQYPPGYGQMAPQFPGGFMPYGLIPSGAFAPPGIPGSQTYAYAYQTVPSGGIGGQPATQGAYVVQNTPTTDGNKRTAFAVEETISPPGKHRKSLNPFGRSSNRGSGGSKKGKNRDKGYAPDLSVVTRGAAPPDPGPGHRSVVLKSGTDPNTGVHTTQGIWTDTVADPSDPGPEVDNPQITRKTITRVTTKSGHTELPPENDLLLALNGPEPAFLTPSSRPPPNAYTPSIMSPGVPNDGNIDFYTGTGSSVIPPERSSTPTSTRRAPNYNNGVIRDRIPFDDESTV